MDKSARVTFEAGPTFEVPTDGTATPEQEALGRLLFGERWDSMVEQGKAAPKGAAGVVESVDVERGVITYRGVQTLGHAAPPKA